MTSTSRRCFLQSVLAGSISQLVPLPSVAVADKTVNESMTFGFGTYGTKSLKTEDAIPLLAEIGYDSVELTVWPGWDAEPKKMSESRRKGLRKLLNDTGLKLTSLMEHIYPSRDDDDNADALERLKRVTQLGHDLSPKSQPLIQTVLGGGKWEEVRYLFVDRLSAWVEVCKAADIVLAIKPHRGGAMSRPDEAVWLFEQIGQPRWLRMVYDYSHYAFRDMTLEQTVKTSLPHIGHVAVKDTVMTNNRAAFVLPGESRTFDYVKLLKLLHDGGYRGDVCCEVSGMVWSKPGYDPLEAAKTCYKNLAPAFAEADVRRR